METGSKMDRASGCGPGDSSSSLLLHPKEELFTCTIGCLLWSRMRDLLEAEQFAGRPIRWREGCGRIERDFTIAGPPDAICIVATRIQQWVRALDG